MHLPQFSKRGKVCIFNGTFWCYRACDHWRNCWMITLSLSLWVRFFRFRWWFTISWVGFLSPHRQPANLMCVCVFLQQYLCLALGSFVDGCVPVIKIRDKQSSVHLISICPLCPWPPYVSLCHTFWDSITSDNPQQLKAISCGSQNCLKCLLVLKVSQSMNIELC